MTRCMAKWNPTTFGKSLDKCCHGCARRIALSAPVGSDVKQAPLFSDVCPVRVEGKK